MSKRAAVAFLVPLALSSASKADNTTTTETATTVVVVTPNAPIVVNSAGAPGMQQPGVVGTPDVVAPSMQAPAVPTPPQNEDWNNVSHINGVPVKVGERGDYLYSYRRVNIAVNPFSPFFGYYDGSISYGVSPHVAISGGFSAWSSGTIGTSGYQVTASLPLYFRRTFSGPFVEPGLIYRTSNLGDGNGNDSWAGPEMLLGWHWNFDSGLNLIAAFGVASHSTGNSNDSGYSGPDTNGYIRVGYNF
jgi:hypothetical protein